MTAELNDVDWHRRAHELAIDARAFIDGTRVEASSCARFDSINPQDGSVVASLAAATQLDVDRAVASARRAFDDGAWSRLAALERKRVLLRVADRLEAHRDELALLDTLEMGMPIASALPDIRAAADVVRACAERVDKLSDAVLPSAADTLSLNLRVPHGVVAAITPWNFPLYVAVSKVVPALAMGNSVVLKPSEIASLSSLRLGELCIAAGLPPGVLNVLPGLGRDAGRWLALHHDVDCLSFTGSTATGRLLMQYAGQSNLKALLLECGGKSPQLVFDDLGDLDQVASQLVQGFTWNGGQVCVSGSRILVARHLYQPLLERMAALVGSQASGAPLDAKTAFGPLASDAQLQRVDAMVQAARERGGRVVAGGPGDRDAGACHYRPTLFADVPSSDPLMQEEVFGPVAGVLPFDSPADALALANATRYGLSATLWTRDFALAHRMARLVRGGPIVVNAVANPRPSFVSGSSVEPTGASGFGTEGGAAGLLAYTRAKNVTFRLA